MNKIKCFIFKLYREPIKLDHSKSETYHEYQSKQNAELESLLSSKFEQFRFHVFDNNIIVYVTFKSKNYSKTLDNVKSMGPTQIYVMHDTLGEPEFIGDYINCVKCKHEFVVLEDHIADVFDNRMRVDLNCGHVVHGSCLRPKTKHNEGTDVRKSVDQSEFGTNEFHVICPLCKKIHRGNLIPIEYILLRAISIYDDVLFIDVLTSGSTGYYNKVAHFPLFSISSQTYNTYYSRFPLWWEFMMKIEYDK